MHMLYKAGQEDVPHLLLPKLRNTLQERVLPCEELDELDRSNELVEDTHALVAGSRNTFLDAY